MSEPETFPLALAGKTWNLPHFRFGVIKKLQPRVLKINRSFIAGGADAAAERLDEAALDELLGVVLDALKVVEPELTREALEDMTFNAGELIVAQTPVMQACGLVLVQRGAEAAAEDPKA